MDADARSTQSPSSALSFLPPSIAAGSSALEACFSLWDTPSVRVPPPLFVFFYALGVDIGMLVFFGEIYPTHIRAKGMTATLRILCLLDLVYLQVTSLAFAEVG